MALALSHFAHWLGGELSGVLPAPLVAAFSGRPIALNLRFSRASSGLENHKNGWVAPANWLTTQPGALKSGKTKVVDIALPRDWFLVREIDLGAVATSAVASAAQLDLVRRTPFSLTEVYWALSPIHLRQGKRSVTQWVLRRADADSLRASLGVHGLHLRRIYVEEAQDAGPVVELSGPFTATARNFSRLNAGLMAGVIVLGLCLWLRPAWQAAQYNTRLEIAIAEARTVAANLRADVEGLRAQQQERAGFTDQIIAAPRLVHQLRDLTVALPDTVWISDLSQEGTTLILGGETSGSAAELVIALAANPAIRNPRLTGQTSRTAQGSERFGLTLELGPTP